METKSQLRINLIPKNKHASVETLLHWAVTGGRFIVILTETIALAAFLYRFNLDRQIVDYHDKNKSKQIIVEALAKDEIIYRNLQDKLRQAKQLDTIAQQTPDLYERITSFAQGPVLFSSLSLTSSGLHMEVTSPTVADLQTFVKKLQSQKELTQVSIDRIEDRTSTAEIAAVISAIVALPTPNAHQPEPPKGISTQ